MKTPSSNFAAAAAAVAADDLPRATVSAVTTRTATVSSLASTKPEVADFVGEVDRSDIVMPRIAIVQKVGDLSEEFPGGSVILNKRLLLAEPGHGIVITVLRARKYFMEIRPFGEEVRPKMFASHGEVLAAGFVLEPNWATGEKATAKPCLDCVVAIHGTEALSSAPEFQLEHDGVRYAVATWSINSPSAYKGAGKALLSAKQMYLKRFVQQSWTLSASKEKFGVNTVFVPSLAPKAANSAAVQTFLDSLV